MQNQEIVKIIENLKGRRSYEEKKASKLGFTSLYAYFEDKILKEKQYLSLLTLLDYLKNINANKLSLFALILVRITLSPSI